jgi:hypothetical protein
MAAARRPGTKSARLALVATLALLGGCIAAPPAGPDYSEVTLGAPPAGKALLVVFRNHAMPSGLAARINVGGVEVMRLAELSFGMAVVDPGSPELHLQWPPASGTPGWKGTGDWAAGSTYFYELTGTAGHGFYFRSQLIPTDARLADVKMRACCFLNTAEADATLLRAEASPAPAARSGTVSFDAIKEGMLQKEVIDLLGVPDEVSSDFTGARKNPFSFSADTFREFWTYDGTGYIAFSLNEYSNTSRVVQIATDGEAKSKAKKRPGSGPKKKPTPSRP